MLNYLALMGWSMPDEREEFTLEEFVEAFTLERISLGGPVFDVEKLTWLNGKYLRRLSPPELLERLRGQLLSDEHLLEVLPLVQERIDTLEGFFEYASFFFVGEVAYDDDGAARRWCRRAARRPRSSKALRALLEEEVDPLLDWTAGHARDGAPALRARSAAGPPNELFMTVRVAATGRAASPPLFETLAVLGKEICRRRLRRAADVLQGVKAARA